MSKARSPAAAGLLLAGLVLAASTPAFAVQLAEPEAPSDHFEYKLQVREADAPPAQGAEEAIAATAEERRQRARFLSNSPLARQRQANSDGSVSFLLRNRLHAPLTVEFEPPAAIGASVNMLAPRHLTLAPLQSLEVAKIRGDIPMEPGEVEFRYSAVIGDPKAKHDDRVVYAWPFPAGAQARLSQGPGGPTHHAPNSRYAIDLAVPEGTPVLAARAGTVVFFEGRYYESGLDRDKFISRANSVRILHDDGSMASYGHLYPASIDLEPGQRVERGQKLGLSGNTGYSSGPHLHFAVLVQRDMEMVSVPFVMRGLPPLNRAP